MNVKSVEKSENSTAKIVLEIEKDQFQTALDKAYRKVKNDIYIPGFRKGKAPRKIVERMYGANVFYEDAINLLFPEVWAEAISTSELSPVGGPSIADLNVDEAGNLTLTVETGLYPEVTLGQYKGIEAEKPEVTVTEADVDAEVKRLADRNSSVATADRPAVMGDTLVIDFKGYKDGVAFEGGEGDNHSLKLGSGNFIPGFEEQLVGMSAGEEKDIEVTFPENYGAEELAGQPATFHVVCHEVKETLTPELDDEFAKDVSETAETLSDLRKELEEKLTKERTEAAEKAFHNAAIQAAMDNMTVVIPDGMVEEQLDNMMEQYSMSMQQSGFSLEQYAQMMGTSVQGLRESSREGAVAQIKNTLLLEKVAEVENIEISDEDIEAQYEKLASEYEMEVAQVKEYLPAEEIKREQKLQKAMDLITESATPKAPEAPAAE
ncbi:MAG: trigger factor [Oscillospiraceae bacterium]|nr:trigger factor [Oscillospiraceae bacterium]